MLITIYKCDLCQTETRESKDMFTPKNGQHVTVVEFARKRYNMEHICVECFNKFNDMLTENYKELTGRKVVD